MHRPLSGSLYRLDTAPEADIPGLSEVTFTELEIKLESALHLAIIADSFGFWPGGA